MPSIRSIVPRERERGHSQSLMTVGSNEASTDRCVVTYGM
jgi:hypothetical protein